VGLAWRVAADTLGRRFVHHGGLSNGGRAFILLYPDERVAVALLTSSTPARFAERQVQPIAAEFLPAPGAGATR
jgi:hypothetical protein